MIFDKEVLTNNLITNCNDLVNDFDKKFDKKFDKQIDKKSKEKKNPQKEISFENYSKKTILLKKFKIPELKKAAKSFKLHISGSKKVLVERLENHFKRTSSVIRIQASFRRWIVLQSFQLRGPAYQNRSICVNDTDFVTMEPLTEITDENFFSYTDEKKFTYGFNVVSLVQMMQNKTKISNPYNREKMSSKMVFQIITLYNVSFILYENFRKENGEYHQMKQLPSISTYRIPSSQNMLNRQQNDPIPFNLETDYIPRIQNIQLLLNEENHMRYIFLNEIRTKPVQQRIEELFMRIDQLGNYTQSQWFSSLDSRGFTRLYRCLYDIWNYRSQMSEETRLLISPFYNPFDGIMNRMMNQHTHFDFSQMRLACLIVMENMVYSGMDEDHRKLGAFHALSALTVVSYGARMAMPWLYESVVY